MGSDTKAGALQTISSLIVLAVGVGGMLGMPEEWSVRGLLLSIPPALWAIRYTLMAKSVVSKRSETGE